MKNHSYMKGYFYVLLLPKIINNKIFTIDLWKIWHNIRLFHDYQDFVYYFAVYYIISIT